MPCRKIVILGPESTGKSTLCEGLAAHFQTDWVAEYAREYLEAHGMDYKYEDLVTIAKGQLALEDAAVGSLERKAAMAGQDKGSSGRHSGKAGDKDGGDPILFIDTNMYVMEVWSEFVFGRCDPWILEQVLARDYDGYLLCRPDLPWTFDKLREYPDEASRQKLFHIYREILINQSVPWAEVGGQEQERLQNAIAAVAGILDRPGT